MAETTIGWTATKLPTGELLGGYTFNPWTGCTKVSAGCAHCYAETMSKRWGKDIWGDKPRVKTSASYWKQPLKWNAEAQASGIRRKVFCASFADVFEDLLELHRYRADLFKLIEDTPMLDWLLLTKRPEHIIKLVPEQWLEDWPTNVWAGTSVEDQAAADKRIPELLKVPARIRFLSAEPLLGSIRLDAIGQRGCAGTHSHRARHGDGTAGEVPHHHHDAACDKGIHWVIIGGESGPGFRPMRGAWALELIQQCKERGLAAYMKQLGGHPDKGEDLEVMLKELRVRQWPA